MMVFQPFSGAYAAMKASRSCRDLQSVHAAGQFGPVSIDDRGVRSVIVVPLVAARVVLPCVLQHPLCRGLDGGDRAGQAGDHPRFPVGGRDVARGDRHRADEVELFVGHAPQVFHARIDPGGVRRHPAPPFFAISRHAQTIGDQRHKARSDAR
ncbi:hypothetical protein [Brevundimonas subvibrioides]|uniref:hypothetical protein n=1 Tax=Brevundimonas subvibrioides TaxID=74313 RepID=UPI0032D5AEA5